MYGSSNTMALPNAALPSNTANARQTNAGVFGAAPGGMSLTVTFIVFVALYLVMVVIQQHQKLKGTIQPKNIAYNLHNGLAIVLQVIVWFGLLKLLLAKLVSIKFPGATTLANIVKFSV